MADAAAAAAAEELAKANLKDEELDPEKKAKKDEKVRLRRIHRLHLSPSSPLVSREQVRENVIASAPPRPAKKPRRPKRPG